MSESLESTTNADAAGKCPVDLETRSLWGLWGKKKTNDDDESASQQQAPSLEEAAKHAQTPHPSQRLPLSTHRLESTIPRSSTSNRVPGHQIQVNAHGDDDGSSSSNTWVYPSEQQVFNAMKRKGWKGIEEESIPSFLQIHNSVNERSWKAVQKWEEACGIPAEEVELARFEGRPTDLTPKAWLLSTLGVSPKPFDRHDWYVVRKPTTSNNNTADTTTTSTELPPEQRYVLDFYMTGDDETNPGGMPRVEIDVRPALDSPRALFQRGQGLLREVFPGIARELDEMRKR